MYRSTAGGAASFGSAILQYLAVPPTVMQELLLKFFGIAVSVDLAGFIGTAGCGIIGWVATNYWPDQKPASGILPMDPKQHPNEEH